MSKERISSLRTKTPSVSTDRTASNHNPVTVKKKPLSAEGISSKKTNLKNPGKSLKSKNSLTFPEDDTRNLSDIDFSDLSKNGRLENAFDKFWASVTSNMEKSNICIPRNTPVDDRISEIQKRIKLNQAVLQSANERMKNISFNVERQNFSQWKNHINSLRLSQDDTNRYEDVKALDSEMEKLRQKNPETFFLKSSPGIENFHKTMERTLNMLDKIQNSDEFGDYNTSHKEIKREFDLDVIKEPDLTVISDEE